MKKAEGKAVIGEVRFCYVHVWEKQNISGKEGDEKYSCCCMFAKNDKKIIEQIKQAIKEALKRGTAVWRKMAKTGDRKQGKYRKRRKRKISR